MQIFKPAITLIPILFALTLLVGCEEPADRATRYLEEAQEYYDSGDYDKASIEVRNALQIEPKNSQARYLFAMISIKQVNFRDGYGQLLIAVDEDPDNYDAHIALGTINAISSRREMAMENLQAAQRLAPDNPRTLMLEARIALSDNETAKAESLLRTALQENPPLEDGGGAVLLAGILAGKDTDEALRVLDTTLATLPKAGQRPLRTLRASILEGANRTSELESEYRSLAEDYPEDARSQNLLAGHLASQNRLEEAEVVLQNFSANNSDDENAYLNLAQFLIVQSTPQAAETALKDGLSKLPDSNTLILALAQLYVATERQEEALALFENLETEAPMSPQGIDARLGMAEIYFQQGRRDTGVEAIERLLNDTPDNVDALIIRSRLRAEAGQLDDAISDARIAVSKEPKNTRALIFLARYLAANGAADLAKDRYRQLLEVDPSNPPAFRELAALEQESGNIEAAEALLNERLADDAQDTAARSQLVDALLLARKYEQAELAALALEGDSDTGIGELQLARIYKGQGRLEEALAAYKQSVRLNPQNYAALNGLLSSLMELDRPNDAVREAEAAADRAPESLDIQYLLAVTYANTGRPEAAEAIYRTLSSQQPEVVPFWFSWAALYPDDRAKRIEIRRQALAASPGTEELGLALGQELEVAGEYDEAIGLYEEILTDRDYMDRIANNLANLLLDQRSDGDSHARALEIARRFERSSDWSRLDTLGWAKYRNGQYPQAVSNLERATLAAAKVPQMARLRDGEEAGIAASRQIAVAHYHLGMAYLANNNTVGARTELSKALEDPEVAFEGIEEARAQLEKLQRSS